MRDLFRFIRHIRKVREANGSKRAFYAVLHIISFAVSILFGYFAYWLIANFEKILSSNFLAILLGVPGIAICAVAAILFFLQGFIAQIATIIFAAVSLKNPEERSGNIAAIIIGLIGFAVIIGAAIFIFTAIL